MNIKNRKVTLNRAAFVIRPYDSQTLTVLTTLLHRFPAVGNFEISINRDSRAVRRLQVRVVDRDAAQQHNIDMAANGSADQEIVLLVGGVLGFYASTGAALYAVTVRGTGRQEKQTLLDSSTGIPSGDLFAVTLVRPGTYRIVDVMSRAEAVATVQMPEVPKRGAPAAHGANRYRPDQPTLVVLDQKGFSTKDV